VSIRIIPSVPAISALKEVLHASVLLTTAVAPSANPSIAWQVSSLPEGESRPEAVIVAGSPSS